MNNKRSKRSKRINRINRSNRKGKGKGKGKAGKTKNKRSRRGLRTYKWTLKKAGMITKKRYGKLLTKKKNKKKLTKNETKDLDRALFVNYCKCTKKLKKYKKIEKGAEYPICTHSIYLNRKMKTPKGVQKKCKRYH